MEKYQTLVIDVIYHVREYNIYIYVLQINRVYPPIWWCGMISTIPHKFFSIFVKTLQPPHAIKLTHLLKICSISDINAVIIVLTILLT